MYVSHREASNGAMSVHAEHFATLYTLQKYLHIFIELEMHLHKIVLLSTSETYPATGKLI